MANNSTATRTNKSEIVRQILHEIGAVTENPPEGWRTTVEERLAKQKLKMNAVTIYQLRRKEIDKATGRPAKKATKFSDLEKLVEVKKFADTLGGLDQLEQAVNFLKQLG